ncbi:MAG TPA: protease pro-enzyme activation domain-containing protein [Chloroflexota bacterium]|nr:protease pro-enzyme activation domain-containing protein [Chloroflexota bacterium]
MRARVVVTMLSVLAVCLVAFPPSGLRHAFAAPGQPRKLSGHVPDVVARGHAKLIGHRAGNDVMTIAVGLPLRDPAALQSFLQAVNDPASPGYHQYLSQAAANQSFNPTPRQEQSVVAWLRANGLTVTRTYPNHLLVDAQGTVAQIESMLSVTINTYQATVRGRSTQFFAPANDPTVPASVSDTVQAITGLDNYPRFVMASNGTAHNGTPYYPQDFANAYDVNPLWNAGDNGSGQHIGITLWTVPPSTTTLQSFASTTGASTATTANGRLKVIQVDGGTTTADSGEAGMDIEYSSGMAPGATLDYYEAPTDSSGNPTDQGLEDALNQAGTDSNNNQQITNSWGGCEASSTSDPFTSTTNNIFSSNSATGHNYLFSSGDNGSWCGGVDPGPDYPTSSPYVTSVGGTAFSGTVSGSYPGEKAWAYCSTCNSGNPEGSGGGYSGIFSRPSWQTGSGLASNGMRGYPDIAADADPNTGAYVCYGSSSSCAQFGGTSLASPLWAGMLADINQYLSAQGKPAAGFIDPTLYRLANASEPYAEYHDVTSGTNGSYNAGTGWDAVTGWGSDDAYNLARDMAGGSTSTPTPVATATATRVPTATSTPRPTATSTPVPTSNPSATATATPKATATSTPRPTATSTPRPTATATSAPSTQVVVNGGFENGTSPWSEYSANGYELISNYRAHAGSYSAWLCGYDDCTDQIYQLVTLPKSFSTATFSYWYYSDTQEASGSPCYDYFYSRLYTSAKNLITTTQQSCNSSVTNGWVHESFNVSSALKSYAGQQVYVFFEGTTDVSLPSDFFVDDVSLTTS